MPTEPTRPKLPHPSAPPIKPDVGDRHRGHVIYERRGGEGKLAWEVEVTPLENTTSQGKPLDAGGQGAVDLSRLKPRAIFEVRAMFRGPGGSAFGRRPDVRRAPQVRVEELELATAMARAIAEQLQHGKRDFGDDPLGEIEQQVTRR